MIPPLTGTRVLELARGEFAATGALLGDWGADVIKLDHVGDARPEGALDMHLNRNKRSVSVDLATPEGRGVVHRLAAAADVFLTDLTPSAAADLDLAPERLLTCNPAIVYARGTALGSRGPERDRPGDDFTAYWARGGLARTLALTDPSLVRPTAEPVPSFGALPTAAMLAGGIAAALYRRSQHRRAVNRRGLAPRLCGLQPLHRRRRRGGRAGDADGARRPRQALESRRPRGARDCAGVLLPHP